MATLWREEGQGWQLDKCGRRQLTLGDQRGVGHSSAASGIPRSCHLAVVRGSVSAGNSSLENETWKGREIHTYIYTHTYMHTFSILIYQQYITYFVSLFFFFLRFYLFSFWEGKRGEKHQCVVASHTPPTGDLASNPGKCPRLGIELATVGSQAGTQSSELHQPGLYLYFSKVFFFLL